MAFKIFADEFNLPAEAFIRQIIQERFPTLDVRKGTAIYRTVIKPGSLFVEPFRRWLNVIRRNQTILAFEDMLEHELDQLLANYFIDRRPAGTASGVVRVSVAQAEDFTVPISAVFSTNTGLNFIPTTSVFISASDLLLNEAGGFFFVDVPVIAEAPGEDYVVEPGTIINFNGVAAAFVDNPATTRGGVDLETNSEMVERARGSIATRTLTSRNAIRSLILDTFDSVLSVDVVGFGDEEMERDTIQAVTSFRELFGVRFARKINVLVDPITNVLSSSPNAVLKAAILDTSNTYGDPALIGNPYFFHALEVDADTVESYTYSAQRGDIVVIKSNGGSVDDGRYKVLNIIFGEWDVAKPNTHFLILEGEFKDTTFSEAPNNPDFTRHEYTIESAVRVDKFHVGGAADIYVNSSNITEEEIFIPQLTEVTGVVPAKLIEIPVSNEQLTYADVGDTILGPTPLFENSRVFLLPFLDIVQIDVVDPSNKELILRTLTRGTDYTFITRNPDTRFTTEEDSFIRFFDSTLLGERIKISYQTNPDIPAIQAFIDDPLNRDVTASLLVRSVRPVQVDFSLSYTGTPSLDDVTALLEEYVESRQQGGTIRASDVVAFLQVFGVISVALPMTMTATSFADDGNVNREVSTDELTLGVREIFQFSANQVIIKTG